MNSIYDNLKNYNYTKANLKLWSKIAEHADTISRQKDRKYSYNDLNACCDKNFTINKHNNQSRDSSIIRLNEVDNLFWYYYIATEGYGEFQRVKASNKLFETEKTTKIDAVKSMRDVRDIYKIYKIKRVTVEDRLINESTICYSTLHILCLNSKTDILFIIDNYYYCFHGNHLNDFNPCFILYLKNRKYYMEDITEETYELIKKTKIMSMEKITNINKPLNKVTYYKLDELKRKCDNLKIEYDAKEKKSELYKKIENYTTLAFMNK